MPSSTYSILTDSYEFKFNELSLQGALLSWNDSFGTRYGKFEYLKVDGAAHEPIGARAGTFSFKCIYTGSESSANYRKLVNTLRQQPRGKLYHPILGQIDAVYIDLKASVDPPQTIDFIEFSLDFEEDQIDQLFSSDSQRAQGPDFYAGQITAYEVSLDNSMGQIFPADVVYDTANPAFTASAVFNQIIFIARGAQETFVSLVNKFSAAALLSALDLIPNPQLKPLLGNIQTSLQEFEAKLRATGRTDAELYPAFTNARQMYSNCIALYNSLLAQKPPIVNYVVPGPLSLVQLCVKIYGADASTNLPFLQKLNPFLKSASLIATGTKLLIPAPILKQ